MPHVGRLSQAATYIHEAPAANASITVMLIVHGSNDVPAGARGTVLAIGNFDGVHRGHQALVSAARAEALRLGCPAGAIVFEPHPREFFQPDKPHFRLTPLARKLALLEGFGLDMTIVVPFDANLAGLTAEAFVERVLVDKLAVRHVVVGYDFHFGKARGGNATLLQQLGVVHGFGVTIVSPVADGGEAFSSSAIRAALAQGDVDTAAQALGHWWRVAGTVIGGAKRGTGLGFPTANMALPRGTQLGHGIYAVRVHLEDGSRIDGAAYMGKRPTFDDGEAMLEVFLFDFDGDLYGQRMEVEFVGFVRADAKFTTAEDLRIQMERDCDAARVILAGAGDAPSVAPKAGR